MTPWNKAEVAIDVICIPPESTRSRARLVFADRDFNGRLDANEPRTESALDGAYEIAGVDRGPFVVREVVDSGGKPTDLTYTRSRRGLAAQGTRLGTQGCPYDCNRPRVRCRYKRGDS